MSSEILAVILCSPLIIKRLHKKKFLLNTDLVRLVMDALVFWDVRCIPDTVFNHFRKHNFYSIHTFYDFCMVYHPHDVDKYRITLLAYACINYTHDVNKSVRSLLKLGSDPNSICIVKNCITTPFVLYCDRYNTEPIDHDIIKLFIMDGANSSSFDLIGDSFLRNRVIEVFLEVNLKFKYP